MILYLAWFFASVAICFLTLGAPRKTQIKVVTFYLLALGVFIGLGDMLGGYDRYIYGELFDRMADVTHSGGNPWTTNSFLFFRGEFGYGTLCALLSYITGNRYVFIFIVTIIIYVLLIRSFQEYVDNVPFAVVMFLGLWMFFSFTYLRQVFGCTIAWLSIRYIIDRNWKLFLFVWFIAFSFHNSAIIFLPLYFLSVRKYSRLQVGVVMLLALVLGLTSLPQSLFSSYGEISTNRVNVAGYSADAGFRWAYLIEALFFLSVIMVNYREIGNKVKDIVMLNIALIFCIILLFFVRSENGGRLGWFFMMGIFCTLSHVCVKGNKVLSKGLFMMIVSFFLFLRIVVGWGVLLSPYKSFLTDGYRAEDPIHERYEYDIAYDDDKFYRPAFWFLEK